MSLDDQLQNLHQEGTYDSSGAFTLNREKALEKLREFRFQRDYDFLLPMLSWAAAQSMRKVSCNSLGSGSWDVVFDGPTLSRRHLEVLENYLFQSAKNGLSDLALSLYGANWPPGTPFSSGQVRMLFDKSGRPRLEEMPAEPNSRFLVGRPGGKLSEEAMDFLDQRFAFAPFELSYGWRQAEKFCPPAEQPALAVNQPPADFHPPNFDSIRDPGFEGSSLVFLGPRPLNLETLTVVVRGAAYAVPALLPEGMWAVVFVPQAIRDASFLGLAERSRQEITRAVFAHCEHLAITLAERAEGLSVDFLRAHGSLLAEYALRLEDRSKAQVLCNSLAELHPTESLHRLILAKLALAGNNLEEAMAQVRRAAGFRTDIDSRAELAAEVFRDLLARIDFLPMDQQVDQLHTLTELASGSTALRGNIKGVLRQLARLYVKQGRIVEAEYQLLTAGGYFGKDRPPEVSAHSLLDFDPKVPSLSQGWVECRTSPVELDIELLQLCHLRQSPQVLLADNLMRKVKDWNTFSATRFQRGAAWMLRGDAAAMHNNVELYSWLKWLAVGSRNPVVRRYAEENELPDTRTSMNYYRQAMKIEPELTQQAWLKIAQAEQLLLEFLGRSLAMARKNEDRDIANRYERGLIRVGERMEGALGEALKSGPVNFDILFTHGVIAQECGRGLEAKEYFEQAMQQTPPRDPRRLLGILRLALAQDPTKLPSVLKGLCKALGLDLGYMQSDSPIDPQVLKCLWPFPKELPTHVRRLAEEQSLGLSLPVYRISLTLFRKVQGQPWTIPSEQNLVLEILRELRRTRGQVF